MNVREYVRVKEAEWNKGPVRRDNSFIPTFCEVVWLSFIQILPGKEKRSATRPAFIVVLPLHALSHLFWLFANSRLFIGIVTFR